ncbi:MAG TPA: alpha/beta fold hydrolase [Thermoanaerobaculia bacterium]|nr:alpha/beta fold hydrolase [Thermoanaerobaculia bacterium]
MRWTSVLCLAIVMMAPCALADMLDVGDGVQLWYTVRGPAGKDPIIVIHGGPGMDANSLAADLAPLERTHRVVYYDQRGGGRSSLPSDVALLTIDHHVQDLDALRRHLGIDKAVLLAHSFGPAIAALYAIRYPEHVDRMIFIGPIPPRKGKFAEEFGATMRQRLTDAQRMRSEELMKMYEGPDVVAACREYWSINTPPRVSKSLPATVVKSDLCTAPAEAIRFGSTKTNPATFSSLGNWDWTASLKHVTAPTLIIHGEEDAIPMTMVAEWATALPHARLLRVPNAAHFPHAERPAIVFPAIEEFLRRGTL